MMALGKSRTLGATAALAAVALAVAGCGSSSTASTGAGARIGSAAISQAADVSGAAKGERVAYSYTASLPSVGKVTMTGTGRFNAAPEQSQMSFRVSVPGISSLGSEASALSNLPLTVLTDKNSVYVKLPSGLSSQLSSYTGGKPWVSVSLTQLASASKIPGLSALLNQPTSPTSPAAMLKQLEAASANGISKVATVTVNGVLTTEYRASLDLSKLSSALPAAQRKVLKPGLAQAAKQLGLTSIPFEVDIDSAHLIRRLTMNFSYTFDGTKVPVSAQMDFLAYGAQAAPTVPAASDTFDATRLLGSFGAMAGAGAGAGSSTFGG